MFLATGKWCFCHCHWCLGGAHGVSAVTSVSGVSVTFSGVMVEVRYVGSGSDVCQQCFCQWCFVTVSGVLQCTTVNDANGVTVSDANGVAVSDESGVTIRSATVSCANRITLWCFSILPLLSEM